MYSYERFQEFVQSLLLNYDNPDFFTENEDIQIGHIAPMIGINYHIINIYVLDCI